MSIHDLNERVREAERRTAIQVLRSNPHRSLGQLLKILEGPHGDLLGSLTIAELRDASLPALALPDDGGPPIDLRRLEQAKRARGSNFAVHVRRTLAEAPGYVGASYLRSRVGGPRWKLQGVLKTLVSQGQVERVGTTSGTRYCLLPRS